MTPPREGFRLRVPHSANCFLQDDAAPFVLQGDPRVEYGLNKNGQRQGSYSFMRFRCNDPDCAAILLVRLDVLSEWLGDGR